MFPHSQKIGGRAIATALLGLAPVLAACATPASAASHPARSLVGNVRQHALRPISFYTLDDQADPTFNQLLGINNAGIIAGYFGSGVAGHPNKGYVLSPPYGQQNYKNENFPGSSQTQVTALNNKGDTAGFWVDANGVNYGFVEWNGVFTSYTDPHTGSGTVNQILGLNDNGIAVGFYTDGNGINHGFALNQATGKFTEITPPNASNVTASGINDNNDIVGFYTAGNGTVVGFLYKNGSFSEGAVPNASSTTPLGVNINDEIVGSYLDATGASHGYTLTSPLSHAQFQKIDDPNGIGTTVVNGVNDAGDLVGFYVDASGNTDGFAARP